MLRSAKKLSILFTAGLWQYKVLTDFCSHPASYQMRNGLLRITVHSTHLVLRLKIHGFPPPLNHTSSRSEIKRSKRTYVPLHDNTVTNTTIWRIQQLNKSPPSFVQTGGYTAVFTRTRVVFLSRTIYSSFYIHLCPSAQLLPNIFHRRKEYEWRYTSTPPYTFMECCFIKTGDKFTLP